MKCNFNAKMSLEESVSSCQIPRRKFLKDIVYVVSAPLLGNLAAGCATVGDTLHNLFHDYTIAVLDENGKLYTIRKKVDPEGDERAAYNILVKNRDEIEPELGKYMDKKYLDEFITRLYADEDTNRAGAIFYHHIDDNDKEAAKKIYEALRFKVGAYADKANIAAVTVGALTIGAFIWMAAEGTGVFAGGGSGGGPSQVTGSGAGGGAGGGGGGFGPPPPP